MGSGAWDSASYSYARTTRAATGTPDFAYSKKVTEDGTFKTHKDLDPKGVKFRESRDSAEHPESRAVAVLFDVTASMGEIPTVLQAKLGELLGILLRKGYLEHPQILFGAVGDANPPMHGSGRGDRAPLQVAQFESDNRLDEHLRNIVLEGGGGGHGREMYETAVYFMARHTALDCVEKRGQKGFLITMGDERPYDMINPAHVKELIGDTLEGPVPFKDIIEEVQQLYHYYHLFISHGRSSSRDAFENEWREYLGENVIHTEKPELVCETIASIIGSHVGLDLDTVEKDLVDVGVSAADARLVRSSVSSVSKTADMGLVKVTGANLPDLTGKTGTSRL